MPESLFKTCRHQAGWHRLHIYKWHGAAGGVPLFCVHALTRVAGDFEKLAAAFPSRPVYAPEMAGRGQSPWLLDSALYSLAHYVDDCAQILDGLGPKPVDWVGTSLGGLIGMMIAAARPGRIRKLVLNDVGPFLPLAALQRIGSYLGQIQRFSDLEQAARYCRTVYGAFGLQTDEEWRAFAKRSTRAAKNGGLVLHYDPAIADAFRQVKTDINLWQVFEKITCPVLLLRGAHSDVLTEKDAHDMTLRGPRARLITFADCGHAPALESDAQIGVVQEFLET